MSNLNEARGLIQADLDHARHVVELWTTQVNDLEKALEQLGAVGESRSALHLEYQGTRGTAAVLQAPVAMKEAQKRGRKPKNAADDTKAKAPAQRTEIAGKRASKLAERSTVQAGKVSEGKMSRVAKKGAAKKSKRTSTASYKDPNSDKTWAGRGRRPLWMTGNPQQYAVGAGNENMPVDPQVAGTQEQASAMV